MLWVELFPIDGLEKLVMCDGMRDNEDMLMGRGRGVVDGINSMGSRCNSCKGGHFEVI